MTKEEIFEFMNQNPAFHLATVDGDKPRVRGMLLYKADENGIVFHTGEFKDVYKQLEKNTNVEVCFNGNGLQLRVSGVVEEIVDKDFIAEMYEHPSREFLRKWRDAGINTGLRVFSIKNGVATIWSMDKNFDEKEYINL